MLFSLGLNCRDPVMAAADGQWEPEAAGETGVVALGRISLMDSNRTNGPSRIGATKLLTYRMHVTDLN